jgi:hypothetical protein
MNLTTKTFLLLGCLGIVIVIAVVTYEESPQSRDDMAYVMAKKFCRNHLLSPATAQFVASNSEHDWGVSARRMTGTGKPYWITGGRVDSQNGFGALIRNAWSAVVEDQGERTWRLVWLKIGEKEIGEFPIDWAAEKQHDEDASREAAKSPLPPTQAQLITAAAVAAEQEKQTYLIEADVAAVQWQIKRAAEGSTSALFDLGVRHLVGNGVEKDEVLGKQMIKNAAEQGYAYAIKKLKTLP